MPKEPQFPKRDLSKAAELQVQVKELIRLVAILSSKAA